MGKEKNGRGKEENQEAKGRRMKENKKEERKLKMRQFNVFCLSCKAQPIQGVLIFTAKARLNCKKSPIALKKLGRKK
jgi:hypothetical protein